MGLPYDDIHLIADPLYGYLRITVPRSEGEVAEATVIDDPWVQRLKRIHQLQSSWWVFPTAEHSRFAHSLGAMHLAGEFGQHLYDTLADEAPDTPSRALVEETLRMAGLLHDLGHGPFSHFFDDQYLHPRFRLDHERISQHLIVHELGDLLRGLDALAARRLRRRRARRPGPRRLADPRPEPRPGRGAALGRAAALGALGRGDRRQHGLRAPRRVHVRRLANAVDVPRLIYYSFVSPDGLTFHKRALSALRAFLNARFYMYENVYFHRIGHAIDLHMREIFTDTMASCCPAARSTTCAPTGTSPSGRCSPKSSAGSTTPARRPGAAAWPSSGSASSTAT